MSDQSWAIRAATEDDIPVITFGEPGQLDMILSDPHDRAIVAIEDGNIIGYATTNTAVVHRTRRYLDVEVHPAHRRRGVGTSLVNALRDDPRPFSVKLGEDSVGLDFVLALGGSPYRSTPPLLLDHSRLDSSAKVWSYDPEYPVSNAATIRSDAFVDMWEQQYRWVHADWAPVADDPAAEAAIRAEGAEVDPQFSSVVTKDDQYAAACFVFTDPGMPTLVAETLVPDIDDGIDLVKVAVGHSLQLLVDAGWEQVAFDGHSEDPHFGVVANLLPLTGPTFTLYEIPSHR